MGRDKPANSEMLKGTLDMMILRTLVTGDAHGHTIAKVIERSSEDVLEVEQGSLYPALHRLEERGWLSSYWGGEREQPQGQVLPPYRSRPPPAHRGDQPLAADGPRHCAGYGRDASSGRGRRMTWSPRTLRRFFHRRSSDEEIVREIAAHLEAERAENQARGMNADEASRQAHIKFGSPRRVQEDLWRHNSLAILEDLLRDLRYAIRTLARTPVFTATAILVMALGIGANTALFTVVKSVLLNPLPYRDPERLVALYEYAKKANDPSPYNPVAAGVYAEWQKDAQRVQQMALVSPWQQYNVAAHGGQLPETIEAAWCNANLFLHPGACCPPKAAASLPRMTAKAHRRR